MSELPVTKLEPADPASRQAWIRDQRVRFGDEEAFAALDSGGAGLARLSLELPEEPAWPFGGIARQYVEIRGNEVRLLLSLQAGARSMPAEIGWHPWFRKPERLEFSPSQMYPRDADGIAILPPCINA